MTASISLSRVQTLAGLARKARMLAYSMGSKRSQRPPGLRKSGMPDSTEMPAPVKATMRRCWDRMAASFSGVMAFDWACMSRKSYHRDTEITEIHREFYLILGVLGVFVVKIFLFSN